MATSKKTLEEMRRTPQNVRFADLLKICVERFGQPRQSGSSHAVFKTPWPGDPRVNIQNDKGKAKAYQVRQVLLAIDKLNAAESGDQNEPNKKD
jgi:CRP-like cAMP-binding protein